MRLRQWSAAPFALLLLAVFLVDHQALGSPPARAETPLHHGERGFRNVSPRYHYSAGERLRRLLRRSFDGEPERGTAPTIADNDLVQVRGNGTLPTATWVGHSTFLIQLDGVNILTDPHWGERASPVAFAGPRRLVPPGVRFEDLPPIDAVVISHDHYDHLDEDTVRRLDRAHPVTFFVPLGVGAWLRAAGIERDVVELDWWEARRFRGLLVVCTPAQHSSGRGLRDQNLRLWASWALVGRDRRVFFAGDTGYYPGLREIGQRLGPFDLAAIPVGGYSSYEDHHPNHVNPEEALALFEDVRARVMVPMHWGTFDLNREPFQEPPRRLWREAGRRGLSDRIQVLRPGQTVHW